MHVVYSPLDEAAALTNFDDEEDEDPKPLNVVLMHECQTCKNLLDNRDEDCRFCSDMVEGTNAQSSFMYKCDICKNDHNFKSLKRLQKHKARHSRIFMCSICDKQFTQKSSCLVHIRTHTGERPHTCRTCDKAFRDMGTLATHEKTHLEVRPYGCDDCDKRYYFLNVLNNVFTRQCNLERLHSILYCFTNIFHEFNYGLNKIMSLILLTLQCIASSPI